MAQEERGGSLYTQGRVDNVAQVGKVITQAGNLTRHGERHKTEKDFQNKTGNAQKI